MAPPFFSRPPSRSTDDVRTRGPAGSTPWAWGESGANNPAEARRSPRVFTLTFAPFGPPLKLAPRLLTDTRTPGNSFFDLRNPQATG